jgi:hypothetical protein
VDAVGASVATGAVAGATLGGGPAAIATAAEAPAAAVAEGEAGAGVGVVITMPGCGAESVAGRLAAFADSTWRS